jgi:hypothetical protein
MAIPMTAKASPSPVIGTTAGAHALLAAVKRADWPAGPVARQAVVEAIFGLADAITNVEALAEGIHWSAIYHNLDIDLDSPEPEHEAPRIAAQDLADTTDAARKVFADLGIDLTETAAAA